MFTKHKKAFRLKKKTKSFIVYKDALVCIFLHGKIKHNTYGESHKPFQQKETKLNDQLIMLTIYEHWIAR